LERQPSSNGTNWAAWATAVCGSSAGGPGNGRRLAVNTHGKKNTRVRQRTDIAATAEDYQCHLSRYSGQGFAKEMHMNRIVYIVGFVVIVIFVLGFFGLR